MGLLPAATLEAVTDKLVGRAEAAVATPGANMLHSNAETGLWQYLDANSEDPELQAALLAQASACDRLALARNYAGYLQRALDQTTWKALFTAIDSYVRSEAGGGYASLAAYLASSGAMLHPLTAEIARLALGASVFVNGTSVVGAMHPAMETVAFDRVYTGAQGSLTDDTTDAGDVGTADVALFAADNDVLAVCSRSRFDKVLLDLSTPASVDVGLHGYYWNGSAWTELTLTDETTGLTANGGVISWTLPADWVPSNHDMQVSPAVLNGSAEEELYTVIFQRTNDTVETPPVATWLQTVPEAVLGSDGKLFGISQPPLAIVRVTGTNECEVEVIQAPEYTKYLCPGTANSGLKLVALTAIGANVTFTLGYTDQAGNAATKAQSAWTSIDAGDEFNLVLDTGDTGVRSIVAATCAVTTTATSGLFAIVYSDYERAIGSK